MKEIIGVCTCCMEKKEDLKHLPIYLIGSEGIWICPSCDRLIRDFISEKRRDSLRKVLKNIKENK